MAKRCLDKITVDGVDYPLMQLNDFSIFNNYTGWDIDCSNAGYSYISSYGYDIMAIGGDRWISSGYKDWDIINSNDGAVRIQNNNWNSVAKNIIFDKSDSNCRTRNSYNSSNQNLNMWCAIIVDDETELGFAIIVRQFPNGGTKDAWIYNDSNNDYAYCKKIYQCFGNVAQKITSNGGGATHIAKVTGQLKDLSSNLSDILMVSGGGGGGYLTGVPGWDGHEIDILWSGENNKMTAQRANDILTFKLYTSGTEIYSFNSPVADPSNINLSFASDSENQVARPAFVYYDGSSSYSYNQEAPTDAEMGDIYTWLSAGLPSE